MKQLSVINGGFRPLATLDVLRVTGFSVFEACPFEWALKFLGVFGKEENKYSKIGTAVHSIMEATMRSSCHEEHSIDIVKEFGKVPVDEHENVVAYIGRLLQIPYKKVFEYTVGDCYQDSNVGELPLAKMLETRNAIEMEFEMLVPGVDKTVRGHVDLILEAADGSLVIVDHKTNRTYHDKHWWQGQLQPMIYAYAVRRMFPGRRVFFSIGYVNLGRSVNWEIPPFVDDETVRRIQQAWSRMQFYDWSETWPLTMHEHCRYCPIKETCPKHRLARNQMVLSAEVAMSNFTDAEKYTFLQSVMSVCEGEMESLKESLKKETVAAGGVLVSGDTTFKMSPYSERVVDPGKLYRIMLDALANKKIDEARFYDLFTGIFKARVGPIDAINKDDKELFKMMSAAVTKQAQADRLSVRKAKGTSAKEISAMDSGE